MKKRVLLALIVALVVFGAVYASAATLNVSGGFIQAGNDDSLYCDLDGVYVAGWGLEVDDGTVRSVRIGGVDEACAGTAIFVRIGFNNGAKPYSSDAGIPNPNVAGEYRFAFPSPYFDAATIETIHVFIEGAD